MLGLFPLCLVFLLHLQMNTGSRERHTISGTVHICVPGCAEAVGMDFVSSMTLDGFHQFDFLTRAIFGSVLHVP